MLNGNLSDELSGDPGNAKEGMFFDSTRTRSGLHDLGFLGPARARELDRLLDDEKKGDLDPLPGFSPALGIDATRPAGNDAPLGGLSSPYGKSELGGGSESGGGLDFRLPRSSSLFPGFESGLGRSPAVGTGRGVDLNDLHPSSRDSVRDMRPGRSILDGDDR
jgi:hypothetical protein